MLSELQVAKQLDDFAQNIMNQAAEAKKAFNEFRYATNLCHDFLRLND